jgi:hypothetical protein
MPRAALLTLLTVYLSFYASLATSEEPTSPLIGLDVEQVDLVLNNLQQDYVTCAAFFTLTAGALEKRSNETAQGYLDASDQALTVALQIADIVTISEDATRARYEMALDEMTNRIDSNFNNFSILMNDHLRKCQNLMNNPDQRTQHWVDQL